MNSQPVQILEVHQLIRSINRHFANSEFREVVVRGEVTNCKGKFFALLDAEKVSSAAYKPRESKGDMISCYLAFNPSGVTLYDGLVVTVRGKIDVYPANGSMKLSIFQVEVSGLGKLKAEFDRLRTQLEREGLFRQELKRPLPQLPKCIGVITSAEGLAKQDIANRIAASGFSGKVILYPAMVQGPQAPASLAAGIRQACQDGFCDVLIVGRGGGSYEELFCFNDEMLARTVRSSTIPIVSAVGHAEDVCLCDFAADRFCQTPTAAGDLVVQGYAMAEDFLSRCETHVAVCIGNYLQGAREYLEKKAAELHHFSPELRAEEYRTELSNHSGLLRSHIASLGADFSERLSRLRNQLSESSPSGDIQRHEATLEISQREIKAKLEKRILDITGILDRLDHSVTPPDIAGITHELDRNEYTIRDAASKCQQEASARLENAKNRLEDLNPVRRAQEEIAHQFRRLDALEKRLLQFSPAAKAQRMLDRLDGCAGGMRQGLEGCFLKASTRLEASEKTFSGLKPDVLGSQRSLEAAGQKLQGAILQCLGVRNQSLAKATVLLNRANPTIDQRFARSVTVDAQGRQLSSADGLEIGGGITTMLADGATIDSTITAIRAAPAMTDR